MVTVIRKTKGNINMKITIKENVYSQVGPELKYTDTIYTEYNTNEYFFENPIIACEDILKDFRQNNLIINYGNVSEMELYLDNELVARLQPVYTIDGESFNNWKDCSNAFSYDESNLDCDNSLSINDITITKCLNIIDRDKALDILKNNYIETFSE